ncbi:MAG TPA: hypothetical protein VGP43_04355 [Chitinophagaceae bacterium]|nr:hypothetical protein [Chitinophagaceae bacterium]
MKLATDIFEELNNISPLLAEMEKGNIFSVPKGYFDVLSIDVIKKLNSANRDVETDKLTVPEGYFESLSSSVLNKIKSLDQDAAQELRTLSPMLYSIQNENVFEVPAGYFRDLQNDILHKVFTKPSDKVVDIKKRDSVWKYAAAAIVTGVIALTSIINFNAPTQSTLSKENESVVLSSIQRASQFKNEQQINAAITTLSDEEIIRYLERTGSDIDNEALTSGIDESELPAAKDYLLNEETLDIYLKQINKNSQKLN